MVIKIDTNKKLNIGILGFRHQLLTDIIEQYDIEYSLLNSYTEINDKYDLILMSGVHYIVPEQYLDLPKYGIFGFHESTLPEGRGSAPIYWAVKTNRINFTVSLFKADKDIDRGNIVLQSNIGIDKLDTYETLSIKRNEVIQQALKSFLDELSEGYIVLREQTGNSSYTKKRNASDSLLDSSKSLNELWDSIRVCDNINFPAYFMIEGKKIYITYKVEDDN
jgi:methionyl-tRNA formyltransferase